MTQTRARAIHEDCGYAEADHADFQLNGKCVIELLDPKPQAMCSRCGSADNPKPLPKRYACRSCGSRLLCYACDTTHNLWCSS